MRVTWLAQKPEPEGQFLWAFGIPSLIRYSEPIKFDKMVLKRLEEK